LGVLLALFAFIGEASWPVVLQGPYVSVPTERL